SERVAFSASSAAAHRPLQGASWLCLLATKKRRSRPIIRARKQKARNILLHLSAHRIEETQSDKDMEESKAI
ncbi:MAG: hypothetical protein ACK506_14755, partial [Pirellula sp.]